MSKRSVFTTITPLPPSVTRQHVLDTFHNHVEMIDLNPLVEERHRIKPPPKATPEEFHCIWYEVTDRVQYLPGGVYSGKVSYPVCFHDLPNGIQTHCYAPMGLQIKGKWSLGGSLPGEPREPVEMGLNVPMVGLYVREDVDMKCNIMLTNFVKKTFKKSHAELVARLSVKAQLQEAAATNSTLASQATSPHLSYAGSVHYSVGPPAFLHRICRCSRRNQYQPCDPRMSMQSSFGQQSVQGAYQQQPPPSQFAPSELSNTETSKQGDAKKANSAPPTQESPPVELP
ncbi:hypothetical protein GMDG_02802 [Pseudogymnoascus destructans 20631-21]|uniref:DUF7053 domain-containing protein n=1 Tax=Pseudogymnoascus destructans (strain ATCC MYA-4855 / 20631-21) TaxID=658429 RepID=L8G5I9_PSED2|nr:hypothetical protein GMDG_02802 [Pseudogymnoascus destructans 20631-21]